MCRLSDALVHIFLYEHLLGSVVPLRRYNWIYKHIVARVASSTSYYIPTCGRNDQGYNYENKIWPAPSKEVARQSQGMERRRGTTAEHMF